MAIIGGGPGGGGPLGSGNAFVGPQDAIELIGDHFYVYTGVQSISGDANVNPMLSFTTGNYYCVGGIDVQGKFNIIANSNLGIQVKLNDAIIVDSIQSAANDMTIFDFPMPIIIPAYTKIEVGMQQNTGSGVDFELIMTGRIYRG